MKCKRNYDENSEETKALLVKIMSITNVKTNNKTNKIRQKCGHKCTRKLGKKSLHIYLGKYINKNTH